MDELVKKMAGLGFPGIILIGSHGKYWFNGCWIHSDGLNAAIDRIRHNYA